MIVCPRTGRTWPDEYSGPHLRTCVLCRGIIDIRREAWSAEDSGANARHPDGKCPPEKVVTAEVVQVVPAKPEQEKLTGRQILARNEWWTSQHPEYKETP